jgi:NodT family efflux transporter outer membrane factor (OMF) lipoprotein
MLQRPTFPRAAGCAVAATGLLAATLVLVAGCAPNLGPRPPLAAAGSLASRESLAAPTADWPTRAWWKAYCDPQLDALIEEGLKSAPTVRQAAARLRSAEAAAGQSRASLFPGIAVSAGEQEYLQSKNTGFPDFIKRNFPGSPHAFGRLSVDLAWDLDLFGRNRANLAAAVSEAQAAQADRAQAELTLSSAIAAQYAELRRLAADRAAAQAAVEIRRKPLALVGQRLENGLETRGEFKQQAASVPAARSEVDALDRQIALGRNQLAALVGAGPDRGLDVKLDGDAPVLKPFGLPPQVGLDLVGRRPDIVAARLRAQAAAKRIRVAQADFYPNLNLAGSVGYQSLGLDVLTSKDSRFTGVGPALSLPIFSGGRARAGYRNARSQYDLAAATYDQTLIQALHEVADSVVNIRLLDRQLADAREALDNSEAAYRIAKARYEGGLSPYISVLTFENALISQRRAVADLEGIALTNDIALVRALGGGFRPASAGGAAAAR